MPGFQRVTDPALIAQARAALAEAPPLPDKRPVIADRQPILAANRRPETNADLIVKCMGLGYLRPDDLILDPTFGGGAWWRRCPFEVVATSPGTDFRALPLPSGAFDVVAYDPPYISPGGRSTSTIANFNDRYGIADCPRTPAELQQMIVDGLAEVVRVARPRRRRSSDRGLVLVKCANYVSSGEVFPGAHLVYEAAVALGCVLQDEFVHVGSVRAQPTNRTRADGRPVRQQHARNNYSILYVFKTPMEVR